MSVYKSGANKTFTFTYGDPVYIVAYAMDDENHRCPIANFDVRFMNNHPMTKEEIVKEGLNNRLISYLDEHYKMATKPITFDDDDVEQTVAAPTIRMTTRTDYHLNGIVVLIVSYIVI